MKVQLFIFAPLHFSGISKGSI